MKITEGFVAATSDGQFLRVSESTTHTGHHTSWSVVGDIEQASVFPSPRATGAHYRALVLLQPATFVPVEVRREVILKGFGT